MSTGDCKCSHDRDRHYTDAGSECMSKVCGCLRFRPRSVADEAAAWLAGREGGQDAGNEGAVA